MNMPRSISASALALAVATLAACAKTEPPQEPVRAVKVMTVGVQPAEFQQEWAGEVRARSESRLGFRVAGKLVARPAEVGQRVKAGQVLAQLDATDYQLSAQAAQAQLQGAQTQRDLAAAEFKRYADLRAQNFISAAELERREATLKGAQATLAQAQAQSQAQANQKGYTALVADRPGVVVAVEAEPGQVVGAGAPVVRVADDGPRDVVVAVPEQQVAGVRVGAEAQVRLWAAGALLKARVREVAASADPVSRTYAVKLGLDGAGAEAPLGATAYVQWAATGPAVKAADALLKLPTSALRAQGQGSAVWVYDPAAGVVRSRGVEVNTADGNQAVIASGLKTGEQVVVAGVHVLAEGQKVTLYAQKNEQKMPSAQQGQAVTATNIEASAVAKVKP
jgi:RND family efflux transporter MFP subunit